MSGYKRSSNNSNRNKKKVRRTLADFDRCPTATVNLYGLLLRRHELDNPQVRQNRENEFSRTQAYSFLRNVSQSFLEVSASVGPEGMMKTEHDTNMCLDYWSKPKGDVFGTIMMYACHNSHNQQWSFRTGSTTGAGVPQGELISQAARNGCMTCHNENTNGNVDVTACNGAQNQK